MQKLFHTPLTLSQVLFPLSLVALVLFILLAFQTIAIISDRQEHAETRVKQEQPLEQAQKVQAQLDALAMGTLRLAHGGDKEAQNIVNRMQQMGISFAPPSANSDKSSAPALAP